MNWPFKNKLAVGKMTPSAKGVMMSKHISVVVLCILALFLTSCPRLIPIQLIYRKKGIYANCLLSGGQRVSSAETLAEKMLFSDFTILYEEITEQDSVLSSVNLLFGGKSLNLANVKYEDIEGIIPDKPCRRIIYKAGIENDDPYLHGITKTVTQYDDGKIEENFNHVSSEFQPFIDVIFNFYGNDGDEYTLARVSFRFNKDKNIKKVECWCYPQTGGYWALENTANKTVFEPPLKLDEVKALFGDDARIFKSLNTPPQSYWE